MAPHGVDTQGPDSWRFFARCRDNVFAKHWGSNSDLVPSDIVLPDSWCWWSCRCRSSGVVITAVGLADQLWFIAKQVFVMYVTIASRLSPRWQYARSAFHTPGTMGWMVAALILYWFLGLWDLVTINWWECANATQHRSIVVIKMLICYGIPVISCDVCCTLFPMNVKPNLRTCAWFANPCCLYLQGLLTHIRTHGHGHSFADCAVYDL